MDTLRVAVLGPGGVGGLLGTLLARNGHAVTCLAGADTAAQIEQHGLRLVSDRYGQVTAPARGAEQLAEPVDVLLVTVKATRLEEALERVPAAVLGAAVVVPLLNGVEHMTVLRHRYPDARVVAGAIRVVASRIAPGVIRHTGTLAAVQLGTGASALARALRDTGIDVIVRPDEAGLLWDKLAFLAPVALLTTTLDAPLGVVREQLGDELRALIEEVAAVARAEGADAHPEETLAFVETVSPGMTSSLQRDVAARHENELDAIGGALLRAAERHGVEVPVATRVVEHLRDGDA